MHCQQDNAARSFAQRRVGVQLQHRQIWRGGVTLAESRLRAEGMTIQYKRSSADCHLDMPCMPPELFVQNASRALKERMPYVVDGPDGPHWVAKNGADFGLVNGVGPGGAKYVPGQNYRV